MSLHCYSGKPLPNKSAHIIFWRFVRSTFKESGYTNRQSHLTSYLGNIIEFTRTVWVLTRVACAHVQSLPGHQRYKSLS